VLGSGMTHDGFIADDDPFHGRSAAAAIVRVASEGTSRRPRRPPRTGLVGVDQTDLDTRATSVDAHATIRAYDPDLTADRAFRPPRRGP
jgi:hypothetical protein